MVDGSTERGTFVLHARETQEELTHRGVLTVVRLGQAFQYPRLSHHQAVRLSFPQIVITIFQIGADVLCVWSFSIREGKLYDYNLRRTVEDFTAFAEGAYTKVEAKDIPVGTRSLDLLCPSLLLSLGSLRARNRVRCDFPAEAEPEKAPATDGDSAKKVVILTVDNFDEHTQSGDWLVELYLSSTQRSAHFSSRP
jgi:hypothetical protein